MILDINSPVYFHWQDQILELQGRFYGVFELHFFEFNKGQ